MTEFSHCWTLHRWVCSSQCACMEGYLCVAWMGHIYRINITCTHTLEHTYTHEHTRTHALTLTRTHPLPHVRMHARARIITHTRERTLAHSHTQTHAHTLAHVQAHKPTHNARSLTHIHTTETNSITSNAHM